MVEFTPPRRDLWPAHQQINELGRSSYSYRSSSSDYTATTPATVPVTDVRTRPRRRRSWHRRPRRPRPCRTGRHRSTPARTRHRSAAGRIPDVSAEELEALLLVQEHDTALDRLRHRRASLPSGPSSKRRRRAMRALERELDAVAARARRGAAPTNGASTTKLARSAAHADEVDKQPLLRHDFVAARAAGDAGRHRHAASASAPTSRTDELEVMEQREALDARARDASKPTSRSARRRDRRGSQASIAAAEAEIDAELASEDAARARSWPRRSPTRCSPTTSAAARRTAVRARPGSSARRARRCHLTIPSTEAERIRRAAGDEVAYCDNCGAILVP